VGGAVALLRDDGAAAGGLDALRTAERLLAEAEALDPSLAATTTRLAALTAEADDLLAALRGYLDELDVDPAHRDAVELRYDRLTLLARKYGGSADAVLAFAAEASERLTELERAESDESALVERLDAAHERAVAVADELSRARAAAAPGFAAAVAGELRGLAMPHARFAVELRPRGDGVEGLGLRGRDEAEFLFSANPGVPPRPLRETASGGELSRAMLAIKSLVHLGHDVRTLIFDEVDTGIGGVTANVLGARLAALAEAAQVVCITHLPQVAVFADRHFVIRKTADLAADTTETLVSVVDGDERLDELARMLGGEAGDASARDHARNLLERARAARA